MYKQNNYKKTAFLDFYIFWLQNTVTTWNLVLNVESLTIKVEHFINVELQNHF